MIEFIRLTSEHQIANRVMTEPHLAKFLQYKSVAELRVFQGRVRTRPSNLDLFGVQATNELRQSYIWDDITYPTFGKPANLQPRSSPSSAEVSLVSQPADPVPGVLTTKYLGPEGLTRVKEWNAGVGSEIDPEAAPADPPSENAPPTRRRKVVKDSDDEDEPEIPPAKSLAIRPSVLKRSIISEKTTTTPATQDTLGPEDPVYPVAPTNHSARPGPTVSRQAAPTSDIPSAEPASLRKRIVKYDSDEEDRVLTSKESRCGTPSPLEYSPTARDTHMTDGVDRHVSRWPVTADNENRQGPFSDRLINIDNESLISVILDKQSQGQVAVKGPTFASPTQHARDSSTTVATTATRVQLLTSDAGLVLPSADFDPTRYGKPTSTAQGRKSPPGQSRNEKPSQAGNPSPLKGAINRGGRGLGRGGRGTFTTAGRGGLVDLSSAPATKITAEPPGFELFKSPQRSKHMTPPNGYAVEISSAQDSHHFLDGPLADTNNIHLAPRPARRTGDSDLMAFSGVNSQASSSVLGPPPGLQIDTIHDMQLANLMRLQEEQRQAYQAGPRKQTRDEVSSRQYKKTMGQHAPNPSKKGKQGGVPKETAKERQERIERALGDAYGPAPAARQASKPVRLPEPDVAAMSAAKKKVLKKSGTFADVAPVAAGNEVLAQQAQKLVTQLTPLFEAGRAFSGRLKFEMQLGQATVANNPQFEMLFDVKRWNMIFEPPKGQSPFPTNFTNMITSNGADVDRALSARVDNSGSMLWNKSGPGPSSVTYEFHCQSKSNEEFWLDVDQSGTYRLRKAVATVGMINVHYPGQVWDACAVLEGVTNWKPTQDIEEGIAAFVNSLYVIPDQHNVNIYFRQAGNNEITIRNLTIKRVSLHNCLQLDRQDFQLQITEVKTLETRVHPKDKKLWKGVERSHKTMVEQGHVHYEMCIVHKGINEVLAKNEALELGELTEASLSGKALLVANRIREMLGLVTCMVERIDWMGASNIGSLPRLDQETIVRQAQFGHSVAPAQSRLLAPSKIITASKINRGTTLLNAEGTAPVHGIRMNTVAEVREDAQGQYRIGIGGARIPVAPEDEIPTEVIAPDDSASQVGGSRRSRFSRPTAGPGTYKPQGFW